MEWEANGMIGPAVALPSMPRASAQDARLNCKLLLSAAANAPTSRALPTTFSKTGSFSDPSSNGSAGLCVNKVARADVVTKPCQPCLAALQPVQKGNGGQILAEPPIGAFGADLSQIGYRCFGHVGGCASRDATSSRDRRLDRHCLGVDAENWYSASLSFAAEFGR